jgi:hypothetical protein
MRHWSRAKKRYVDYLDDEDCEGPDHGMYTICSSGRDHRCLNIKRNEELGSSCGTRKKTFLWKQGAAHLVDAVDAALKDCESL